MRAEHPGCRDARDHVEFGHLRAVVGPLNRTLATAGAEYEVRLDLEFVVDAGVDRIADAGHRSAVVARALVLVRVVSVPLAIHRVIALEAVRVTSDSTSPTADETLREIAARAVLRLLDVLTVGIYGRLERIAAIAVGKMRRGGGTRIPVERVRPSPADPVARLLWCLERTRPPRRTPRLNRVDLPRNLCPDRRAGDERDGGYRLQQAAMQPAWLVAVAGICASWQRSAR